MKKILLSLALSFILIVCAFSSEVFASPSLLADEEGLLTQTEAEQINRKLQTLSGEYGMDFVIVTSYDFYGKDAKDFADNYYDNSGYRNDGIILVLSDNLAKIYISTAGNAIGIFPDRLLDSIIDEMMDDLSAANYADAFGVYIAECEDICYDSAQNANYTSEYHAEPFISLKQLGICIVIGLVIGFIGVSTMKSGMKTVRHKTNAQDYMVAGSLNLTQKHDTFLYRNVSRIRRQTNQGSSGRSHGGSGRSFR